MLTVFLRVIAKVVMFMIASSFQFSPGSYVAIAMRLKASGILWMNLE